MAWYLILFLVGAALSNATKKCSFTFSKKTAQVSCTNITVEEYLISVLKLKNSIINSVQLNRVAKISIVVQDSNIPIVDERITLPWDESYYPLIQSVKIINSSVNVVKPFSKWPALETLDLSRNNISDYRFLSKMKKLKRLFLSHSKFSSDNYLFTYLQREQTRLNLIDLSYCNLDKFDVITNLIGNYDLSYNPNLTQIRFNHSLAYRSPFLNLSGNTKITSLRHLRAVNNNFCISVDLSHSNISADSLLLKTIHISEIILLNNNNIPFLDENDLKLNNLVSKKCPGRISIHFSNSRITGISTNFFSNYTLDLLNLSYNNLGNLTGSIFRQADILNLDLSDSNIFSISSSVFNYLIVDTLDLSRNNISSLDGIFDYIESLKHLDMSFNPIESLDQKAFKNCQDLATLNLSNVYIKSISENTFANILSLKSLTLSFVDTIIDPVYIQNMHLTQLTIINTNVSLLKSEQFKGFYNLRKLTFLESSVSIIDKLALKGLFNLNRINNFKELVNYDISVFQQLLSLEYLDLSNHNLKKLTLELEDLQCLKMLNLSSNSLSSVDVNSFATLTHLQELSLADNQLSSIVVGTFRNLSELTHLYLNQNQLQQLLPGLFSGLENLFLLDISHNELLRTKPHLLFGVSVPKLRYLYLQGNSIGSEYAQGDNLIRKNEFGIIANHNKLKYIDINKNEWRCTTLIDILTVFKNKEIVVIPTKPEYTTTNINGISCT